MTMKIIVFCRACGSASKPHWEYCENCSVSLTERENKALGHFDEADWKKMREAWGLDQ